MGSVSVASKANSAALLSQQEFDPWGKVRSGSVISTTVNYTGQRLDGSGLLYYHARMYNPVLGRFVSADSVVPGSPSGGMDGVALKPLTVDFHEVGFVAKLNQENGFSLWFQLSDDDKQRLGNPWGPENPQTLNRYTYVHNNPMRWNDPTGHLGATIHGDAKITFHLSHEDVQVMKDALSSGNLVTWTGRVLTVLGVMNKVGPGATVAGLALVGLSIIADLISLADTMLFDSKGVDITISTSGQVQSVTAPTLDRQDGVYYDPSAIEKYLRRKYGPPRSGQSTKDTTVYSCGTTPNGEPMPC